jgi:hypothetical protein
VKFKINKVKYVISNIVLTDEMELLLNILKRKLFFIIDEATPASLLAKLEMFLQEM